MNLKANISLPEFTDFKSISNFFETSFPLSKSEVEKRKSYIFGYEVVLYKEWNGRNVYITYFVCDTFDDFRSNFSIWYSEKNDQPKFNIWLMRRRENIEGSPDQGKNGSDGFRVDLTDPSIRLYGDKEGLDEVFGKPMRWIECSETGICDTINHIIDELGKCNWQLIRKK